jgi:ureidoglycolate lyase
MNLSKSTATLRHVVTAEPVTPEAFAPFGQVISTEAADKWGHHTTKGPSSVYQSVTIDSDHPVELLIMESDFRPFKVRWLERHVEMEQSIIALGGQPFLAVVAPPDVELEDTGLPPLDTIKVFFVPGDAGVHLARGTWHEPPLPLSAGGKTLITSHASLSEGLRQGPDPATQEIHFGDVDKRNLMRRLGHEIRIELPA